MRFPSPECSPPASPSPTEGVFARATPPCALPSAAPFSSRAPSCSGSWRRCSSARRGGRRRACSRESTRASRRAFARAPPFALDFARPETVSASSRHVRSPLLPTGVRHDDRWARGHPLRPELWGVPLRPWDVLLPRASAAVFTPRSAICFRAPNNGLRSPQVSLWLVALSRRLTLPELPSPQVQAPRFARPVDYRSR